jgi:hypothetical protein|tara:strand:+ start:1547 stop:1936 length:390 start_codon:yes stop_codon:yes gene_type:complete
MANSKKFDIDLKFGLMYENKVKELLEGKGKIEVKAERDAWKRTGNMVVEIKYKGKDSGLSATKADWWIHVFTTDGSVAMALMIPVNNLKRLVVKLIDNGVARVVYGGDNNNSQLVLLPIAEVVKHSSKL